MKLLIFFSLLGNLFVPWGVSVTMTPLTLAIAVAIGSGLYGIENKIEPDPMHPDAIRTVRGVGYMFVPPTH